MSAIEINSTEGLNPRCKHVIQVVDSFLHGHELATNRTLNRLAINIKDHRELIKCLKLKQHAEISRKGVVLYGVK
ncbi:hypothetical protein [Piscirickettsia salmonis]|uniref:hypothetical protein n=1 Tax=Piscirickettsia salmonis TaxID=1238 RepID=UPI0007C953F5|nr:hypothetical protein A0O36_00397 [Piscirickettsiaceae bacterium NZ-RLO1]